VAAPDRLVATWRDRISHAGPFVWIVLENSAALCLPSLITEFIIWFGVDPPRRRALHFSIRDKEGVHHGEAAEAGAGSGRRALTFQMEGPRLVPAFAGRAARVRAPARSAPPRAAARSPARNAVREPPLPEFSTAADRRSTPRRLPPTAKCCRPSATLVHTRMAVSPRDSARESARPPSPNDFPFLQTICVTK
jgi:hypothetical protein